MPELWKHHSILLAVNMINENQKSQGVKTALDKATDDAKKDKASFQKGFKEGQANAKPQSESIR